MPRGRTRGTLKHAYRIRKSVANGVAPEDVDGGFAWSALIPFLSALGIPILDKVGKWVGDRGTELLNKIKNKLQGKGLRQSGAGLMQAGSGLTRSGDTAPGNIPMYRPAVRGGFVASADLQRFKNDILPILQNGDIEMFKKKFMETLKKRRS